MVGPFKLEARPVLVEALGVLLQAPPRAGKRHCLATLIKKRVSVPAADHNVEKPSKPAPSGKPKSSRSADEALSSLVSSKIEDGNLRAAVRILCSDETLAEENNDTFTQLCSKHPRPPLAPHIKQPSTTDAWK